MRHLQYGSKCSAICLLLASFGLSGFAQQLNNSDFESHSTQGAPPDDWVVELGSFVSDAEKHHVGKFAGKLDGRDGASAAYQDVTIEPGKSYTLSGYWRNGDKTAAFDVARVSVMWLSEPGGKNLGNAGVSASGAVAGNWAQFQLGPLQAPAGAHAARIRLASTFNTAAFDDLQWESTDGPRAVAPLQGPGSSADPAQSMNPMVKLSDMPMLGSSNLRQASKTGAAIPTATKSVSTVKVESSGDALNWMTDLTAASQQAAALKRKLLLFVAAPSDSRSSYYDQALFSDDGIQSAIAAGFVPVRLELAKHRDLLKKLEVAVPGTIVIYSSTGKPLDLVHDQLSPTEFQKVLAN